MQFPNLYIAYCSFYSFGYCAECRNEKRLHVTPLAHLTSQGALNQDMKREKIPSNYRADYIKR